MSKALTRMDELKSCPFCKSAAAHVTGGAKHSHYVMCKFCNCSTALRDSPEIATTEWNRRVVDDERLRARNAALLAGFQGGDLAEIITSLAERSPARVEGEAVMVPREPTNEMMDAAVEKCDELSKDTFISGAIVKEVYKAMLSAAPALSASGMQGHDEPCYYCDKPCNALTGNPDEWPIPLCHADDPGKVKWHHTGCVSSRLSASDEETPNELLGVSAY